MRSGSLNGAGRHLPHVPHTHRGYRRRAIDQALGVPDVLRAGMDLEIVTFIFVVRVKFDAVARESAGYEAPDGLIGCLAG